MHNKNASATNATGGVGLESNKCPPWAQQSRGARGGCPGSGNAQHSHGHTAERRQGAHREQRPRAPHSPRSRQRFPCGAPGEGATAPDPRLLLAQELDGGDGPADGQPVSAPLLGEFPQHGGGWRMDGGGWRRMAADGDGWRWMALPARGPRRRPSRHVPAFPPSGPARPRRERSHLGSARPANPPNSSKPTPKMYSRLP